MSHSKDKLRGHISADKPLEQDLMTKVFMVKQGLVLSLFTLPLSFKERYKRFGPNDFRNHTENIHSNLWRKQTRSRKYWNTDGMKESSKRKKDWGGKKAMCREQIGRLKEWKDDFVRKFFRVTYCMVCQHNALLSEACWISSPRKPQ